MSDKEGCLRCGGQGWYWRVPDGFNPFLAGGHQTARTMWKSPCSCTVSGLLIKEETQDVG